MGRQVTLWIARLVVTWSFVAQGVDGEREITTTSAQNLLISCSNSFTDVAFYDFKYLLFEWRWAPLHY